MIKSITVTNPKNESLVLELTNPKASGLYVRSIDGLGPSKASIHMTELATLDGGVFNSSRMSARNILLTLGMLDSPTIEDARLRTYKYFPIKRQVTLKVATDKHTLEATGYIESHQPNIFSEQEETQISIVCPDPFFYAKTTNEQGFSGVMPEFTFPFSNNSLTTNLIRFGSIRLDTRANVMYDGDVSTGFIINIHALDVVRNLVIFNTDTNGFLSFDTDKIEAMTGAPFASGDDIIVNTVSGKRSVMLLRSGVYRNVISCLDRRSTWFQLSNGLNQFDFTAEEGDKKVLITFSFRNAYGGI